MDTIEELIDKLDAKYPKEWDMYRTALGEWYVSIKAGNFRWGESSPRLSSALRAAVAWVPLPEVPRRPQLYDCLVPVKSGSYWRLEQHGRDVGCSFSRKKDATDYAQKMAESSAQAIEEWEAAFGWTNHKVEGIDFKYR